MKHILVHANVSRHCQARFDVATRLAKAFDAKLTALFTSARSDVPFFMMEEIGAKVEPTMRAWWLQTRDRVKGQFDGFVRSTAVKGQWIEAGDGVADGVHHWARCADLTIVGQTDPDELLPRSEYEIPERVALEAGGPALIIPFSGESPTPGRRVLIAWDGSAPSARAVKDALPFLERADRVIVLTVKSAKPRPGADAGRVVSHLSDHGIKAETCELSADDAAVGDLILSEASRVEADLVVMGAYGHARAREFILGGATRTVFGRMTMPILMSH